jgi:hypothetical protein
VRLNKRQAESTCEKIRATSLINRLEAFVLGEKLPQTKRKIVLTRDQLKGAELLLERSIPVLSRSEVSGPDGGPIATRDDTPGLGGVKGALANMLARAVAGERAAKD